MHTLLSLQTLGETSSWVECLPLFLDRESSLVSSDPVPMELGFAGPVGRPLGARRATHPASLRPDLSWGPQLLLTSCPGPAMCLRPHTPHFVLSTPQTGPSGCEHPPPAASPSHNTPSPPPHLHFFPVTKPCGSSLPFLCLSPSPHTGPKDHHLPLDLPVERGWGRRKRAPLPAPGAEQALRAGAPAQLPHSPRREGVSLA